jgi:hypothetical protein
MMSKDRTFYEQKVEQELRLAARADSPERRKRHLNQAAAFSTLGERVVDPRPVLET